MLYAKPAVQLSPYKTGLALAVGLEDVSALFKGDVVMEDVEPLNERLLVLRAEIPLANVRNSYHVYECWDDHTDDMPSVLLRSKDPSTLPNPLQFNALP